MKRILASVFAGLVGLSGQVLSQSGAQGDYPVKAGQYKMAIIILDWSDKKSPSRQDVVNRMWNDSKSARNYFMDMSRGAFEFSLPPDAAPDGTVPASTAWVYGPYELSVAAGYTEDITYANADDKFGGGGVDGSQSVARTLAAADGYVASNYDYIMYVTPKSDSTGGLRGYAGLNATYSHIFEVSNRTINHELGHNLTLHHSNTGIDGDNYSSHDCVMANSASPHVDGPHSYQLGWFPDSNYGLKSYGQYDIDNLAQPGSDELKVIRFDRGAHGATTNPSYNLWVEYRVSNIGHDDQLNGGWDRNVNVHYSRPSSRRPGDYLSYLHNNNVAHFLARGEYTDPDGICSVRFVRQDTSTNRATVQLIDPNGNQPPSVVANENYRVAKGATNFTLLATDPENDELSYTLLSPPSTGTLTHVGSTFTYIGATEGSYTFSVRVNDGQYDSFDEALTITVVGDGVPTVNAGPDQLVLHPSSLPWTPAAVSTQAWFDAADASSITESSGKVSLWADKSGKGNHAVQSSGSSQPSYDVLNSRLTFDGNDIMKVINDPFHGLQDFAVIALQKWNVSSGWGNAAVAYHGDNSNGWQIRQQGGDYGKFTFTRRGTNGGDDPSPTATVNSSDFIGVGLRQNTKDIAIRHNGAETYSATNDTGPIPYAGVNRSSIGGRYGGDDWSGPGNQLTGDLKEIIVIKEASLDEVERAEGYLAHKWGLATSLPDTHPYKASPPAAPPSSVSLNGSAIDPDGDEVTYEWSVVSGPGTVTFINPTSASTFAMLSAYGRYVLRLTASDGPHSASDEVVINFIRGDGPEIGVSGNGNEIASGDTTPSPADATSFGPVSPGSSKAATFTIGNYGNADLVLSGTPKVSISGSSAFSVTSQPASPVVTTTGASPSLGTSDFVISFSPTNNEAQFATLSIASNDSDEPTYTFAIAGNRPTVDVVASDAMANEVGPDTGAWTFTRSGSGTASSLTVHYALSGTATEADDYAVINSGSVVIPAGQSSATLHLTPTVDALIEGPEIATLTITDNSNYIVGNREGSIIIDEPDQVLVTAPNGGESLIAGNTTTLEWQSLAGGHVSIELLKGGALHTTIAANTPNDGSLDWIIPLSMPADNDYRIRITLLNGGPADDVSDADFAINTDPLAEALDAPQLVWSTNGNADWAAQTTTTHDGVDAAQAGLITHSQSSHMEVTVTGPGTLTFWWKVSSESNYDWLRLRLNGVEQTGSLAKISGEVGWVQKTLSLPAGNHTLRWTYSKDGSVSSGADTAWVDEVVFTPTGSYTVTYLGNGSTGGSVPVDSGNYSNGAAVTVLGNTGNLVRTGYSFIGWNTAANGGGAGYSAADTFNITEDVTLHAQWAQTFADWGGGVAFGDDVNGDGMANGLAWLLGASAPNTDARTLLPSAQESAGSLVLNFACLRQSLRGSASLKVQASDDLGVTDAWNGQEAEVPDSSSTINGIQFTITPHSNPDLIDVQASIPAGAGRCFGRLSAAP